MHRECKNYAESNDWGNNTLQSTLILIEKSCIKKTLKQVLLTAIHYIQLTIKIISYVILLLV